MGSMRLIHHRPGSGVKRLERLDQARGRRDEDLGNVSATLYYYPNAAGGFFLRGGFGFAAYSADGGGGNTLTGTGLGFTLGLGYDFRVARNFSLTPVFNISAGSLGELQLNSNPSGITGAKESVAQLGLGFTWH